MNMAANKSHKLKNLESLDDVLLDQATKLVKDEYKGKSKKMQDRNKSTFLNVQNELVD